MVPLKVRTELQLWSLPLMSQPLLKAPNPHSGRTRRLNRRALVALVVIAIVLPITFLLLRGFQTQRSQPQLLEEAKKQLESGKTDLALSYLNNFILANPQDSARLDEALNLRAKTLAETARDDGGVSAAIKAYNPILARDAEKPEGQEIRRKLAILHLKLRPPMAQAAEILATELIRRGANDADAHRLLGKALRQLGQGGGNSANEHLDKARSEFELAEKLEPGDVETAEELADLYFRSNKPQLARQVLDQVLETSKGDRDKLAAAHLARSRFFNAVGERAQAAIEVQAAIKVVPGNLDARLVLAEMAALVGDSRTAKSHIEAIDSKNKGDLRVKYLNGMIQLTEQKHDEAVASWRSGLLQSGGNDVLMTWRLAQMLLQLNRIDEAQPLIEQYRRLLGKEPPTPEYQYLKALTAFRTNHTDEAITLLESIRYTIEQNISAQLHFTLGQAYEVKQESVKALEAYRKAADLSTRWPGPCLAIARLEEKDRPDKAIATLTQGLEAMPGDPALLAGLGRLLWRRQLALPLDRRNWSELEKVIELGKRVAPSSVELALVQADYLNVVSKSDDALALLQAGVKQNPNSVQVWLALVNLLNRRGQVDESLIEVDRATAAAGEHAVFRSTKATLLMSKSRPKQARTILVEGLAKIPPEERAALWKTLGDYYVAQNDTPNARKAYVECAKLSPDAPEPRMILLDLALNSGDDDQINSEVEAMKNVGGSESVYYRVARVQKLLRDRPKSSKTSPEDDVKDFNEAEGYINSIKKDAPKMPLGMLLEARLLHKRGNDSEAIKAYEVALKLGAGQTALRPLVVLLTQAKKFDELDRLKRESILPVEMEKLAAELSLKMGDVEHAQQLIDRLVQGDPQGLDIRIWQSKVLKAMGRPAEAERAIRFLLDQRPDEPGPWLQLLMFQVGQGQTQAALDTVEQIRARVKTDLPELLWAMCYRVSGQTSKADDAFRAAIRKWPDDTRVRLAAINFYETAGRLGEAEASLRHLLLRDPTMAYAIRKLATLLSARTNDNAAWQEALKVIGPDGSGGDGPEDRLTRAIVYSRGPRPEHRAEAIKILQAIVADSPNSTVAQFELAKLYQRDGNLAKARDHARRAASTDDAGPEPILAFAGMLLLDNQVEAAGEQLSRLEAMAPDSLPTIELRARLLNAQGKAVEAGQLLEKAFEDRSKGVEAFVTGMGILQILDDLKLKEVYEKVGRQVAELSPEGSCAWAGRLAKLGRVEEAAKLLDEAAKAGDPRNAGRIALQLAASRDSDARWLSQADQFLGMALKGEPASIELLQAQAYLRHLQSRHQEEIDLYNQVLARNPSDYLFLNNMAWTLSENMNQPEEGLKRIDDALAKLGFDPHVADTRGVILTRLGRYDEALKELQAASTSLPNSGAVFYHLARLCKLANRTDDFLKYRDFAKQAGLTAADLQTNERAEMEAIMKESN